MKNYHLLRKVCAGFLIVTLLQISGDLTAQTRNEIQGRVLDSRTKEPVTGASVILDNTTIGVSTGIGGTFSLAIPDSLIKRKLRLIISMIGYIRRDISIKKEKLPVKRDFLLDPVERR